MFTILSSGTVSQVHLSRPPQHFWGKGKLSTPPRHESFAHAHHHHHQSTKSTGVLKGREKQCCGEGMGRPSCLPAHTSHTMVHTHCSYNLVVLTLFCSPCRGRILMFKPSPESKERAGESTKEYARNHKTSPPQILGRELFTPFIQHMAMFYACFMPCHAYVKRQMAKCVLCVFFIEERGRGMVRS